MNFYRIFSTFGVLLLVFCASVCAGADIRVRVTWGGGETNAFYGQIVCTSGPVTELTPLGVEMDAAGTAVLVRGQVVVSQENPKSFNGADITLPWREDGVLKIRFSRDPKMDGALWMDIPLRKLLAEGFSAPLLPGGGRDDGNRLSVKRVPGDALRVRMPRDHVVFEPGETFRCEVAANFLPISEKTEVKLNVQMLRGRETYELHKKQYAFSAGHDAAALPVEIPLPREEGVYDVVFTVTANAVENPLMKPLVKPLTSGPLSGTALDPTKIVLQRRVQLITISPEVRVLDDTGLMTTTRVVEIDPTSPKWWESMNRSFIQLPRWGRNNTGAIGSGDVKIVTGELGSMMELPVKQQTDGFSRTAFSAFPETGSTATEMSGVMDEAGFPKKDAAYCWEAYPLALERIGMPHILEIEYPAGVEQTLGISILEPNSAGAILPVGVDSGIDVPATVVNYAKNGQLWERHRIIFWPKSKTPIILLTNRHTKKSAFYGKMRILSVGNQLPRLMPRREMAVNPTVAVRDPDFLTASGMNPGGVPGENGMYAGQGIPAGHAARVGNPAAGAHVPPPERMVATMFCRPIFPDFFSATKMPGGSAEFTLSDWLTFHDGAKRMVEYLNYVGYNGLFLSIYADGSTIYPSRMLGSTPRFDSGAFFNTGQDLVQKDVAEMLFRLCDRESITFVPMMDFSSPIPELEVAARFPMADPHAAHEPGVIRWTDAEGNEMTTRQGAGKEDIPRYNILHPRVQRVILACVAEVVLRYEHHPSFGGISLQLTDESIFVLPPPHWGMDPVTMEQFVAETKMNLQGTYEQRVKTLSSGPGKTAWMQWRAAKLALFYRQVAALLNRVPQAKLYLTGTDFLNEANHPELHPQLSSQPGQQVSARDILMQAGICMEFLQKDPKIVVPRCQKLVSGGNLSASAAGLGWQQAPGTYRTFQTQNTLATAFYHRPETLRLPAFDALSPYQPTFTWGMSHMTPAGSANRRRFAESLAMMDAQVILDGGWAPMLGQEDAIRSAIRVIRQLPPTRFAPARMSKTDEWRSQPIIFRSTVSGGKNFIYAINMTPFPLEGMVYLQPDASLRYGEPASAVGRNAVRLGTQRDETLAQDVRGTYWRVSLAPYQVEALRTEGPAVALYDPVASFPSSLEAAFQQQSLDLYGRLHGLKTPPLYMGLRNASFEDVSTAAESIPQWYVSVPKTAMNVPQGSARLDRQTAYSGNASLHMQSSGGPLKIMSQPFTTTATGRVSVSVWVKTGKSTKKSPLRVILEGDHHGILYRRTAMIHFPQGIMTPTPQDMSGRGEWTPYLIHVNDLPLENVTNMRLGFELTDAGELWLDNIHLSDMNFSPDEQRELARQLDAFRVRLQHGDLVSCVNFLEGYWPRFLRENIQPASISPQGMEMPDNSALPTDAVMAGHHAQAGSRAHVGESAGQPRGAGGASAVKPASAAGEKENAASSHGPKLPSLPSPPNLFQRQPEAEAPPPPPPVPKPPEKKKKSSLDKIRSFLHL